MNGFVILIILVIVFNILKSVFGSVNSAHKPKQIKRRQNANNARKQNVWQVHENGEQRRQSNKGFKESWQQSAIQEARRKREDKRDDLSTRRKDPGDKNRNRTADWGSRAGPGLLNAKTVLILIAVLIIGMYVSLQIS